MQIYALSSLVARITVLSMPHRGMPLKRCLSHDSCTWQSNACKHTMAGKLYAYMVRNLQRRIGAIFFFSCVHKVPGMYAQNRLGHELSICLRTYACKYINKYMQTYALHTYAHTYIHAYVFTYKHTCIHTYLHAYIHTHTRTIHTHVRTYVSTYMHIYICTQMGSNLIYWSNSARILTCTVLVWEAWVEQTDSEPERTGCRSWNPR